MRQRMRKLVGMGALVTLVVVYVFAAMLTAVAVLPGTSALLQLAYYFVAGLLWALPAALLIRWMQRPDPE